MKKILRTKLEYNCNKTQEFNYGLSSWYTKYDRSFDMYVSASTKEECEKVMESFEDAIRAEGIQDYFDSNLEPEFDEKKKIWVGAVEVYVGNDYVADEKAFIKEVYANWKKSNSYTLNNINSKNKRKDLKMIEEISLEKIQELEKFIGQFDNIYRYYYITKKDYGYELGCKDGTYSTLFKIKSNEDIQKVYEYAERRKKEMEELEMLQEKLYGDDIWK